MVEIKPNMYVRYKTLSNQIKIAKIIEIDKKVLDLDNKDCTAEEYIIGEPSYSIIDLIEVEDIIKYHPMQNGDVKTNILYKTIKNGGELALLEYDLTHKKKKLISIVTKEMFKSMEYEVE